MKVAFNKCLPELLRFSESYCNGCGYSCESCNHRKVGVKKEQPRVGQMIIVPCYVGELQQVDSLDETERGEGGFGSTDRK